MDSYGLDIMRERAGRLGVELRVRERRGGGTVVEIGLGGSPTDEAHNKEALVVNTEALTHANTTSQKGSHSGDHNSPG
jgi:hypothetical protein